MVRDISIDLLLSVFIHGRSSQASHIPVVQYLTYGRTANFRALKDSLHKREEQDGNSDLCGIKIGPQSQPLFLKIQGAK